MYQAYSKLAQAVCEYIAWNFDAKPIEVMRRGDVVYVTGTLLKPNEWNSLLDFQGQQFEFRGKLLTIKITRVPRSLLS